jgi:hypothetical protein
VSELIGKVVLVGVTCVGPDQEVLDEFQTFGTVERVDANGVIGLRRAGLRELFGLPPVELEPAGPGIYVLRESGVQVEDPDFVVSLTVACADRNESLDRLRTRGYVPPS